MKYCVVTFGCRANEADSCGIEQGLRARGAEQAPAEVSNLVVINTCSVTAAADQGARQAIRRIARLNPAARIVATGCYATRRPGDLSALPAVVRVVPNDQKDEIARLEEGPPEDSSFEQPVPFPGMRGRTVFPLRVQTGCDERCSYCVVPFTRGPSRSVPLADVLDEARRLSAAGFREIVLTAVHLGAYGRDLVPAVTLLDLLAALDRLPGDSVFRLSSIEPMDCSTDLIEVVVRSGRFAPHFHLPLQHASDRMLHAMRRPYTLEPFGRLLDDIRRRLPDAAIGSDVIAGFPGERVDDFSQLERYLRESPITHLHVFPYSSRPGTEAARLPGKTSATTVRQRAAVLREIGLGLRERFEATQLGRLRPALTLVDGTVALTDNFLKVRLPPGLDRNKRVTIRIVSAAPLQGEVVP